ncbi:MAG: 2TM domain-containing protein [Planctomyces sp.]|nr:2TM domain-containing protein [Planctomyces sp.]
MATSDYLQEAENRAERGFMAHAAAYVIITGGLAALNLTRNPDRLWFLWVLGAWGLGVLLHAAILFLSPEMRAKAIHRIAMRMDARARRPDLRDARREDRVERQQAKMEDRVEPSSNPAPTDSGEPRI